MRCWCADGTRLLCLQLELAHGIGENERERNGLNGAAAAARRGGGGPYTTRTGCRSGKTGPKTSEEEEQDTEHGHVSDLTLGPPQPLGDVDGGQEEPLRALEHFQSDLPHRQHRPHHRCQQRQPAMGV